MVFIIAVVKTVKIGNLWEYVVSVVVQGALQCVLSALCAVSKRSFPMKGVAVIKPG